jgi:hypothetical protein
MAKSVTVTFDDGTNHTYDNVPDEIGDDQITARAGQDFADKGVTGVVQGSAPSSAPETQNGAVAPSDISTGDKVVGGLATAANLAAEHPALAAGAAGLWKANKMANTWMAAQNANTAATNARTAQMAQTEARVAQRPGFGNVPKTSVPQTPGLVDAAGNPISSAPKPGIANLPGAGAGPTPTTTIPEAPPSSANYMSRVTQLADRYLPVAKSAAGTVGKVIAPVARVLSSAPVIGAQLMTHSTGLNPNEQAELLRRQQMAPTITQP